MLDITSYDYFIRYLATQADINEKKVTLWLKNQDLEDI